MDNPTNTALCLIQETRAFLQDYREPILADLTDASYFRQKRQAVPLKSPLPPAPFPSKPQASLHQPEQTTIIQKQVPIEQVKVEEKKVAPKPHLPNLSVPKPPLLPEPPKQIIANLEKIEAPPITFFQALLSKIAPHLRIIREIPNDALAKKINTRWKTKNQVAPITLLSFQENSEQKTLLEQITKALDAYFAPARLVAAEEIEKEKQWETFLSSEELQIVICCDYTLWQLPFLRSWYKEVPAQELRLLKEKPLFFLPDLSLYLKDPLLKRSLWKVLCQTLRLLPSFSTKT